MTAEVITTKECSRCGGTGRYSFNLRDLDRCYGCGGTGKVPCAPKGQKKIKPTAELKNGKPGDIISHACVLYRIERITWIKLTMRGFDAFNQKVRAIRLIDNKAFALYRCANEESANSSFGYSISNGVRTYHIGSTPIEPTEDMIGQETDVSYVALPDDLRAAEIERLKAKYYPDEAAQEALALEAARRGE